MKDCVVKSIGFGQSERSFLEKYSIPFSVSKIKYAFGLFLGDEIVGLCTFGGFAKQRQAKNYKDCVESLNIFTIDKSLQNNFVQEALIKLGESTNLKGVIFNRESDGTSLCEFLKGVDRFSLLMKGKDLFVYYYHLSGEPIKQTAIARNYEENILRAKFFKEWTRELAWVYGLILGDGYVHFGKRDRDYVIGFCGNSITVDRFRSLLNITTKKTISGNIFTTKFISKEIGEWFEARGVCGKKSRTLPWPIDIPNEFMADFLRGLVDTDGHFALTRAVERKKGNSSTTFGFTSATYSFVKCMQDYILKELGLKSFVGEDKKNMNGVEKICYRLTIRTQEDVIKIGDYLYKDSEEIRNEKKYIDFMESKGVHEINNKPCYICGGKPKSKGLCAEHYYEEYRKNEVFCFCGKEALDKANKLCRIHYDRFHSRKRLNPSITIEDFVSDKNLHLSFRENDKTTYEFERFDKTKSALIKYNEVLYLVDLEDIKLLLENNWRKDKKGNLFRVIDGKKTMCYRYLLNVPEDKFVVHKNRNYHDIRKENLKIVSSKEMILFKRNLVEYKENIEFLEKKEPILERDTKAKPKCLLCDDQSELKGLCSRHYYQKYKEEKFGHNLSKHESTSDIERQCVIKNCDHLIFNKTMGLCTIHYNRYRFRKDDGRFTFKEFVNNPSYNGKFYKESQASKTHRGNNIKSQKENIKIVDDGAILTLKDKEFIFDKEDLNKIHEKKWRLSGTGLLFNRSKEGTTYLWRLILNDNNSHSVIFKDGNKSNYRKSNLRPITRAEFASITSLKKR